MNYTSAHLLIEIGDLLRFAEDRLLMKEHKLATKDYCTLEILQDLGPTPVIYIRNKLLLSAPSFSRVISRLEEKGLIVAKQSSTDGRESILSLSEKGKKLTGILRKKSESEANNIPTDFSETELQKLRTIRDFLKEYTTPLI